MPRCTESTSSPLRRSSARSAISDFAAWSPRSSSCCHSLAPRAARRISACLALLCGAILTEAVAVRVWHMPAGSGWQPTRRGRIARRHHRAVADRVFLRPASAGRRRLHRLLRGKVWRPRRIPGYRRARSARRTAPRCGRATWPDNRPSAAGVDAVRRAGGGRCATDRPMVLPASLRSAGTRSRCLWWRPRRGPRAPHCSSPHPGVGLTAIRRSR